MCCWYLGKEHTYSCGIAYDDQKYLCIIFPTKSWIFGAFFITFDDVLFRLKLEPNLKD